LEQLEQLSAPEQGALLGALLDGRDDAAGPLSRIAGGVCLEHHTALSRGPASTRRRAAAVLSRSLSPLPAGLERIHPSWLDHLISQQSPRVAALVLRTLPATVTSRLESAAAAPPREPPGWVRPWLVRAVLGGLEPMPGELASPPTAAPMLPRLPQARLQGTLTRIGLLVLASLVRQAADPALAERVGHEVPGALRRYLLDALELPLPRLGPGPGALPNVDVDMPGRLVSMACALLEQRLPRRTRRQLAQRLPRDVGLTLWSSSASPPEGEEDELTRLLGLAWPVETEDRP
jgi:hypothetical protein